MQKINISYSIPGDLLALFICVFDNIFVCEQIFSSLLIIANKHWNRFDASDDVHLAMSNSIHLRTPRQVKESQARKSHSVILYNKL